MARKDEIRFQLTFEHPLMISGETLKNRDEIQVTLLKPRFQQLKAEIPKQATSKEEAEEIETLNTSVQVGSSTILAGAFFANLLMKASLSNLWGMINSVQVISFLALQHVYFPSNSEAFFEFIIDLSEFDLIPQD